MNERDDDEYEEIDPKVFAEDLKMLENGFGNTFHPGYIDALKALADKIRSGTLSSSDLTRLAIAEGTGLNMDPDRFHFNPGQSAARLREALGEEAGKPEDNN